MSAFPARQRGGFLIGLVVGLLVGLALALGVALYVTKVPIPFVNKVPQRTAEQDAAEAERSGLPDHVIGKAPLAVPVERVRRHPVGREGPGHLLDRALVFRQLELAGTGIDRGVHGVLP